ncbi:MAG: metallophosphoesterase [Bacillota bacterium]|nr:metallophosphoesterase [Bacillota bacterium]
MALWALSDLHLGHDLDKPMDVFGPAWAGHVERMAANWDEAVAAEDTVIIGGDISWAMKPEEAIADLAWIHARPGRKVLLKGNHDYWWPSTARLRRLLATQGFDSIDFLFNSALACPEAILCGSRGWLQPGDDGETAADAAIRSKECGRLRLSLEQAAKLRAAHPGLPLVAVMHFPPFRANAESSCFTEILAAAGIRLCLYGHLHGLAGRRAPHADVDGIRCLLTASDYLGFRPLRIDPGCATLTGTIPASLSGGSDAP